jgi:hypothetical protein
MRRRQVYAARTAVTEAVLAAAIQPKEVAVPDTPPQQQTVVRPPPRRPAKPKKTKAPV